MPPEQEWREVVVEHEGVRLVGEYSARSYLQVRMKEPFDGIALSFLLHLSAGKDPPGLVAKTLKKIYDTCLWVQANQEELRARYRPVQEAGEHSDEYLSYERYVEVEDEVGERPGITREEYDRLAAPLEARLNAWYGLQAETIKRALKDLGQHWPLAHPILNRLAPHFDPDRAREP